MDRFEAVSSAGTFIMKVQYCYTGLRGEGLDEVGRGFVVVGWGEGEGEGCVSLSLSRVIDGLSL